MELADRIREAVADRYAVEGELGRGGMAVVFLARDLRYDRRVAIKVLRPELSVSLVAERFLREIHIAAQLQHPLIVPLYDSGGGDDLLWYVMPFVEGETLRARLRREQQLPLADALSIARDAAEALHCAHQHGFVHRDIKPENILLSGGHAVIADFGIARALTHAAGSGTSSGVAIGTPSYMSPEQASGSVTIDARSDIYSLGCVLYEMLAGEPPFTGPTPQAVIARHVSEQVPSLSIVRPGLGGALQDVVERALAKVPADRFATASDFEAALGQAATGALPAFVRRRRWRRGALLAGAAVLVLGAVIWRAMASGSRPLDPSHVVVYPLATRAEANHVAPSGEDVATAVLTALNFAGSLEGQDGWRLLDERQRQEPRLVADRDVLRLSRRAGARFAVDGWVLASDSVRAVVRLHDLASDSTVQIMLAFPGTTDAWTLGLRAAVALLPSLIPAGQYTDLRSLNERSPGAVAEFLRGEQAYRRARFEDALQRYRAAVAADSGFALAALRGAQAASWSHDPVAPEFVRTALANEKSLTPRDRYIARGFDAYLLGRADSAVGYFRRAIELEPAHPEVWMPLGEVYTHLVPDEGRLDSLAAAAFNRVYQLDSTSAPLLYHLTEISLRQNDVGRAAQLMRRLRPALPDSAERVPLEIMLRCVSESPDAVEWGDLALRVPNWVVDAGRGLAVGGLRQPRCAEAAWRAVLVHDTGSTDLDRQYRWGAVQGLHALLVAEGRTEDLLRLLQGSEFSSVLISRLYILAAVAGAPLQRQAEAGADTLRQAYRADPGGTRGGTGTALWHLGIWEAQRGHWVDAQAMADTLAAWAVRKHARREALMAKSVMARALVARGDSAAAMKLLAGLEPDTVRTPLTWNPWESLGGERLLLAQLLFARGEYAEAYRVASELDAPDPVPYIMYVPASLVLRMRIAERLGDQAAAEAARRRLVALGRQDLVAAR